MNKKTGNESSKNSFHEKASQLKQKKYRSDKLVDTQLIINIILNLDLWFMKKDSKQIFK